MNVLHHRYYFWKHHNEVNQRLSTYSTFNELKRDYIEGKIKLNTEEIKEIVIYGKPTVPINSQLQGCPVSNCILHTIKWRSDNAQMVIITNRKFPDVRFHKNQVWLAYDYEAPPNSRLNKRLGDKINFTATYRHDSTIHLPYGKLIKIPEFNSKLNNSNSLKPRNISATKKKTVAWIVSNCSPSSPRNLYAYELSKYITVDVYGKCNQRKCQYSKCHKMLRKHYKFYLSFENCLCQDYITEKFFENALMNNVIPVVMGASIEEYQSVAPPNSFIHVDQFASPKKLAEYLHYLDKNHTAFNEYFTWQDKWRVVLFPGRPECDFCLLANVIPFLKPSWYSDMRLWLTNSCEGRKLKWKVGCEQTTILNQ
ncbi:Glycoprotein 3-alpha-L-fucosyltransferase A [Schistosoma japonicum]|nr:Glycoprotein 3-alpha-L-fucosyltransferase A [Schistosoma japonicum]